MATRPTLIHLIQRLEQGPAPVATVKRDADSSAPAPAPAPAPAAAAPRQEPPAATAAGSRAPDPEPPPPSPATIVAAPPAPRVSPSADADDRGQTRSDVIFPFATKAAPYHIGCRRFRAARPGGRMHAGCDLPAPPGTRILAMADGTVVCGPTAFYDGTYYLTVAHDNGILVRYGEIKQIVPKGVRPGARVRQGQTIAVVGHLMSLNTSMLHLEMYGNAADHSPLTVRGVNRFMRRGDLMDPTTLLDAAPVYAADPPAGARGSAPSEGAAQVRHAVVDALKVGGGGLRLRDLPRIVPGAAPRLVLAPGAEVDVVEHLTGGAYPFGEGNQWLKIRYGETSGYVAAYFIQMRDPAPEKRELPGDVEAGYVAQLQDGLDIREEPRREGRSLVLLAAGTRVEVLGQQPGGFYDATHNDWLRVRASADGRPVAGYAAALGIDIGAPRAGDAAAAPPALDRWTRVVAETDWPGASAQTADQLGRGTPGGTAASRRLAEADLERVARLASLFRDVAQKLGIPAALLAGVASRESRCGQGLRNGWGDNGTRYGILQVDKRSHRIRDAAGPAGVDHLEQGAELIGKCLDGMIQGETYRGWEDRYLLQGATAAYHCGLRNVRRKDAIDQGTTGDDYGADTLARARYFFEHPRLHLFRN